MWRRYLVKFQRANEYKFLFSFTKSCNQIYYCNEQRRLKFVNKLPNLFSSIEVHFSKLGPLLHSSANKTGVAELTYAPKNLADSWSMFFVYRVGELVMVAPFMTVLPLWMPLCWLALNYATNTAMQLIRKIPAYALQQPRQRLLFDRFLYLMTDGALATAVFFFYVPGNVGLLSILGIFMVSCF